MLGEPGFVFYKQDKDIILGRNLNLEQVLISILFYKDKVFIYYDNPGGNGYNEISHDSLVMSVKSLQKKLNDIEITLFKDKKITLYKMSPVLSAITPEGTIDIIPFNEISFRVTIRKGYTLSVARINGRSDIPSKSRWFKSKEKLIGYLERNYFKDTFDFMLPILI
jgi:hypothetical protein